MTVMLCRNRVADFQTWKAVFDSNAPAARAAGLVLKDLWRDIADPDNVFFLFEVRNLDAARVFIADPAAAEAGRVSGVLDGEYHFLSPGSGLAAEPQGSSTAACAWCGTPLSDDDTFLLRAGARLCGPCAENAGRIAGEQGQRRP